MKNICVMVIALVLTGNAFAKGEFESGDNVVSAGINVGSMIGLDGYQYSAGGYGYSSSQSIGYCVHFEHGIWDVPGPGVVSLGGYLGFKSYSYDYTYPSYYYSYPYNYHNLSYGYKRNYIILGVRGAYHFNGLHIEKLDLYAGIMAGFHIVSYSYYGEYGNDFHDNYGSGPNGSAFVGARYYLLPSLAAYLELGAGVAILSTGLSLKF